MHITFLKSDEFADYIIINKSEFRIRIHLDKPSEPALKGFVHKATSNIFALRATVVR